MRAALSLVLLLVAGPASATIVTTAESLSGSQTQYPASAIDLINQGQATLASATHTGYTPSTGTGTTSTDALNDGIFDTDSAFDLDVPGPAPTSSTPRSTPTATTLPALSRSAAGSATAPVSNPPSLTELPLAAALRPWAVSPICSPAVARAAS